MGVSWWSMRGQMSCKKTVRDLEVRVNLWILLALAMLQFIRFVCFPCCSQMHFKIQYIFFLQPHEPINIVVQADVAKSENVNESFTVICMEKKPSEVRLPVSSEILVLTYSLWSLFLFIHSTLQIDRPRPSTANAHGDSAINGDLNMNCILNIDCIESTDPELCNYSAFEHNSRTNLVGYRGHDRTWLDSVLLRCYYFCCCEYLWLVQRALLMMHLFRIGWK